MGFPSWRRRSSSLDIRRTQQVEDGASSSSPAATSEAQAAPTRRLSSSFASSQAQREPIRSFIHGTVRDQLGECQSFIACRTRAKGVYQLQSIAATTHEVYERTLPNWRATSCPIKKTGVDPRFSSVRDPPSTTYSRPKTMTTPKQTRYEPPTRFPSCPSHPRRMLATKKWTTLMVHLSSPTFCANHLQSLRSTMTLARTRIQRLSKGATVLRRSCQAREKGMPLRKIRRSSEESLRVPGVAKASTRKTSRPWVRRGGSQAWSKASKASRTPSHTAFL